MIVSVGWGPHVVRQGETVAALASRLGVDPNAIWRHPDNAAIAKVRKSPQILLAGDILSLPGAPPPVWFPVALGRVNKFVGALPRVEVLVMVPAYAGASYTADADGIPLDPGTVPSDGSLSLAIYAQAKTVDVTFTSPGGSMQLRVGHLDPIDTPTGHRQRLTNLGIPVPDVGDDQDGHALRRATALFQLAKGLEPTGELDAVTQSGLEGDHGS